MVTRQELQDDLFSSGICFTKRTKCNEIHRNNLKSRSSWKTPLLLKRHREARLKFVREQMDKEKSYWERVLCTDGSKIELFGRNSINHVWREDEHAFKKKTIPTVKFGCGSIMVWGCASANGTGNIAVIDGRMNPASYQNILEANLIISELPLIGFSNKIMTRKTHSKVYENMVHESNVNALKWQSQSPHLNPI